MPRLVYLISADTKDIKQHTVGLLLSDSQTNDSYEPVLLNESITYSAIGECSSETNDFFYSVLFSKSTTYTVQSVKSDS